MIKVVRNYLIDNYKFDESLRGFQYLLFLFGNPNNPVPYKTTDIYKMVAEAFDTNVSCVDRNLRHLFAGHGLRNRQMLAKLKFEIQCEYAEIRRQEDDLKRAIKKVMQDENS